ncbi:MAG: patatin family protein [Lactobacillaceae bacterium]|jgi:predicted patatin/cPLA2 family phospholipase|nr:patatin family protein [Lactobacillaceae bacterium]
MKTGLVLEGGAKRGIYTAGVLDVLLENEIMPDGVIGVSAGAIHGASYVSKQAGRSIRYNMKYGNDYRFMSWRSWFETGDMVDEKFSYHELPEKLDPFDNETFMESKTKFYVTCSNLETGRAEHIHCTDLFKQIDYLRASASMPFVSRIVDVGGKKLLDGGISDGIPLKAFIDMGYDRCIVVQTRMAGYRKEPNKIMNFLAKIKYRKYPKFVEAIKTRYKNYNDELDYIDDMNKKGLAFVIRPSKYVKVKRMEQDLGKVKEMYELGRSDALRELNNIRKFFGA